MPALRNQRRERFAQGLAAGKTATDAYADAGYTPNRFNASALKTNQHIIDRVRELQGNQHNSLILSRQYVIDALLENVEKALGRKPVKIGVSDDAKEIFVYRGDVANRAIQLAGVECGMFTERKEIKHLGEFEKLSDVELVQLLEREAQSLLEDQSGGSDDDGNGNRGA